MQDGSIGWSVGATLGYAQAVPEKRVISFIGDGSFQVDNQKYYPELFFFLTPLLTFQILTYPNPHPFVKLLFVACQIYCWL